MGADRDAGQTAIVCGTAVVDARGHIALDALILLSAAIHKNNSFF